MQFNNLAEQIQKNSMYFQIKNIVDLLIALLLILVLSPVFIIIALCIKIDSQGPILFSQTRAGLNGKIFHLYKFRTMFKNVEKQAFAPKNATDTRVTNFGKLLRRTHMDELPQLFNILKGEMSLIGPRPEMTFISQNYTPHQKQRLLVKPGITGLWQIFSTKAMLIHENLEYDLYYIQNLSFILDVKIILWTISALFQGRNAF